MGHVDEVNPPDLAAQPSMISLKCQIPRFGWNPDAVSTVSNLPQHASLLHRLPRYIFPLAQRLWMDVSASDWLTNVPLLTEPRRFVSNLHLVWKITLPWSFFSPKYFKCTAVQFVVLVKMKGREGAPLHTSVIKSQCWTIDTHRKQDGATVATACFHFHHLVRIVFLCHNGRCWGAITQ